jgi:hypothetical protein
MKRKLLLVAALVVSTFANAIDTLPPAPACQAGAFLDAISLLNAAVRASRHTPQEAAIAQAELDSILRLSLKQAKNAYPCARGTLAQGYDVSYAETVRMAGAHLATRKAPRDTVALANDLAKAILASGAPPGDATNSRDDKAVDKAVPPGPFTER